MIGSVAIAVGTGAAVGRRHAVDPAIVAGLTLAASMAPLASCAVGFLWWAVVRFRSAAARSRADAGAAEGILEAAELIGLGLAGGLSVPASVRLALDHGPSTVAPHLGRLIGEIDRRGVVPALARDRGPTAAVSSVLVTATASGAPVLPALEAHLRQEHHRRHTASVEAARRLPIRLLVPLTLLVLPGFVLITVGPAVVDSLARLSP